MRRKSNVKGVGGLSGRKLKKYEAQQDKIKELKKDIAHYQAENQKLRESIQIAQAATKDERVDEAIRKADIARENYERTVAELRDKKQILDRQIEIARKEHSKYNSDINKFIKKAEKQNNGTSLLPILKKAIKNNEDNKGEGNIEQMEMEKKKE